MKYHFTNDTVSKFEFTELYLHKGRVSPYLPHYVKYILFLEGADISELLFDPIIIKQNILTWLTFQ